jgi:HMGL-like
MAPELKIILHFHDTRGLGVANAYAGLEMGVDTFDSSVAGLGVRSPGTRERPAQRIYRWPSCSCVSAARLAIPRQMFQEILRLIAELRPQPSPAPA